jgi:hypothetical protein
MPMSLNFRAICESIRPKLFPTFCPQALMHRT